MEKILAYKPTTLGETSCSQDTDTYCQRIISDSIQG